MALQLFKIASTTVETPQSSITFSSIPSGYTDLKIVVSARQSTGDLGVLLRFNSNSASYSSRSLYGNGSTAASSTGGTSTEYSSWMTSMSTDTANTFGSGEIYIPNYNSSNYKSISSDGVNENNGTTAYTALTAGLWSNTAAVTSITLSAVSGTFVANSTFTLYGVL